MSRLADECISRGVQQEGLGRIGRLRRILGSDDASFILGANFIPEVSIQEKYNKKILNLT